MRLFDCIAVEGIGAKGLSSTTRPAKRTPWQRLHVERQKHCDAVKGTADNRPVCLLQYEYKYRQRLASNNKQHGDTVAVHFWVD